MTLHRPTVDYRKLRLSNLNSTEFRHLKLLLFWPVFGLAFLYVERFYPVAQYHPVYCPLDDKIPFCEYFLVPYLFWFVFLVGMHVYLLLYDVEGFRKFENFIIFTYSVTMVVYFLYPTCQELRPPEFARDNVFTRFLAGFYQFDTNTNVCPSMHVIGSLAVAFAAVHTPGFSAPILKAAFWICAVLICVSTVFLKQHSIIDVLLALPMCALGYWLFYCRKKRILQI